MYFESSYETWDITSYLYGKVANKAWKFKQNPHGVKIHLNKLNRKGYHHKLLLNP